MPFDIHQKKVIANDAQSLIVLAAAGSGKTTTMIGSVQRHLNMPSITEQLPQGTRQIKLDPHKIRVLSFTNVAADTFRAKLLAVSGPEASDVKISTMDTFAIDIIKYIYPNASVDMDENAIARTLYEKLGDKTGLSYMFPSYSAYFDRLLSLNKKYKSSNDIFQLKHYYSQHLDTYVDYVIDKYQKNDAFSIPLEVVYRFAILTMLKYEFIPDLDMLIVDELQDTSDEQFMLLSFLQAQLKDLKFVGIGDVSQSMYRWNNAKPQRVSQYITEYAADVLQLPNNYRSHPDIIDFANDLLAENLDNISNIQITPAASTKFTPLPDEDRVEYSRSIPDMLKRVKEKLDSGVPAKNIAIIARSTGVLNKVEKLNLEIANVPLDSSHMTKNKRIAYYQYILRSLSSFITHIDENKVRFETLFDFLETHGLNDPYKDRSYFYKLSVDDYRRFLTELKQLLQLRHERTNERMKNILYNKFDSETENAVKLSTVHGVKGEEYQYIYYIPSIRQSAAKSMEVPAHLTSEEKEELFGMYAETQNIHYVAITRAIEQVTIVQDAIPFTTKKAQIQKLMAEDKAYNKDIAILLKRYQGFDEDSKKLLANPANSANPVI